MSNYKHTFEKDIENLKISIKNIYGITRDDEDRILLKIDELRTVICQILEERKA